MRTRRFQLVVIDLMSVVTDAGTVMTRLFDIALRARGIDATREEIRSVLGLPLRRAIAALFRTGSGVLADAKRADLIHDDLVASLLAHYSAVGSVRPVDGATRVVTALRAQGLGIAVGSVMPRAVAEAVAVGLGWFDRGLIDTMVVADDVPDPRPQPGMIRAAMRSTGVPEGRRVISVGGTPADLAEGTLAGCGAVIGLISDSHSREELLLRPHTHLFDRMLSLLDLIAVADVIERGVTTW